MTYTCITTETEGGVLLIRLNRPEALNALNSRLVTEIGQAVAAAANDDAVRCIVITGSEKAFAAGADIREMADRTPADAATDALFRDGFDAIARCRKPVIAAVAGYALGGGCELAMACDFIIAAENARFGQPEINLGVIAGLGGTQRLTRAVGKAKSMDMHLTGRFMDAVEAERTGLVSRIVPNDRLVAEALDAARRIAAKSRPSVEAAKDAVNSAEDLSLSDGLAHERRAFDALFATEDQKEGMRAFLEKRQPQFRDR